MGADAGLRAADRFVGVGIVEGDSGKALADHGHQMLVDGRLREGGAYGCTAQKTEPGQKSAFRRHPWILSRDAMRSRQRLNSPLAYLRGAVRQQELLENVQWSARSASKEIVRAPSFAGFRSCCIGRSGCDASGIRRGVGQRSEE